jgi:hypothetical protein
MAQLVPVRMASLIKIGNLRKTTFPRRTKRQSSDECDEINEKVAKPGHTRDLNAYIEASQGGGR